MTSHASTPIPYSHSCNKVIRCNPEQCKWGGHPVAGNDIVEAGTELAAEHTPQTSSNFHCPSYKHAHWSANQVWNKPTIRNRYNKLLTRRFIRPPETFVVEFSYALHIAYLVVYGTRSSSHISTHGSAAAAAADMKSKGSGCSALEEKASGLQTR